MFQSIFAAAFLAAIATPCLAAGRCEVRATQNVKPTDVEGYPAPDGKEGEMRKGERATIVGISEDERTGKIAFCAYRTYCYPTTSLELISPCRFDAMPNGDEHGRNYEAH